MSQTLFPSLAGVQPTVRTLQWYSRAVGLIPRAHAEPHPKWWHISLRVQPDGLTTVPIPLPDGKELQLKMHLRRHAVLLLIGGAEAQVLSMAEGLSSNQFGEQLLAAVANLGLSGDYLREKFENAGSRQYDPDAAETFLEALTLANRLFKEHRTTLSGEIGPVQLWPHGFDLAFEWFGTRTVTAEEGGEKHEFPSQLSLGFSPGEPSHPEPYFYSNPWPFEADQLLEQQLPSGARWFTESWQGGLLPYQELVADPQGPHRLLAYAKAVYQFAAPTLTA